VFYSDLTVWLREKVQKRILLGMPTQYLCTKIHHQCFVVKNLLARFKPVIGQTASSAQNTSSHQLNPTIEYDSHKILMPPVRSWPFHLHSHSILLDKPSSEQDIACNRVPNTHNQLNSYKLHSSTTLIGTAKIRSNVQPPLGATPSFSALRLR
jgi:hypothetical protein